MQISEKLILMSANGEIAPMSSKDAMAIEAALSTLEAWPFENQNYNCPCIHPSQCDESCTTKRAPDLVAWESTTVGYVKYVTDARYQKFSDEVKKWYKPFHCSSCSAALEAALSAAEPVAAMTTDYLGCEYVSMDVAGIEKIAAAHSKGPTEVVYLYAAPPAPSVAVKALQMADETFRDLGWHDKYEATTAALAALSAQVQDVAEAPPVDSRHRFEPNSKYPWFCAVCGYAPHEPLKHLPAAPAKQGGGE
ncbi:hypothetical protein [Agrobacterium pusense]|uniref:hypothetical protein n=1 Tax=Agrobacterium pusense TaxID=648995 RepID=UPI000D1B213E|nr:hypothetical protein [Agrobacterium pusense]